MDDVQKITFDRAGTVTTVWPLLDTPRNEFKPFLATPDGVLIGDDPLEVEVTLDPPIEIAAGESIVADITTAKVTVYGTNGQARATYDSTGRLQEA